MSKPAEKPLVVRRDFSACPHISTLGDPEQKHHEQNCVSYVRFESGGDGILKYAVACAFVALINGPICSGQTVPKPPASKTTPAKESSTSPAIEAQRVAQELWGKVLTHCGPDYYFTKFYDGGGAAVYQYKTPAFDVHPLSLTAAERMNGDQWYGYAVLLAPVYRKFSVGRDGQIEVSAWMEGAIVGNRQPFRTFSEYIGSGVRNPGGNIIGMSKYQDRWSFDFPSEQGQIPDPANGAFNVLRTWQTKDGSVTVGEIERHKISCAAIAGAK